MDHPSILIICLVALLLMSAFFSASETAFTSFSDIRMKKLAKTSNSARLALKLKGNYDRFLSTVLIGNNIVNIVGTTLATILFIAISFSTSAGTVIVTVAVLLFGEIFPKTFAKMMPEAFAKIAVYPLYLLYFIFLPISWVLEKIKLGLMKLFKFEDQGTMTEEEFEILVDEIHEEGTLNGIEKSIILNTLEYGDLLVGDIMTKNKDVIFIKKSDTLEHIQELFETYNYSRLPISKTENINGIFGVVYQKEFYEMLLNDSNDILSIVMEPLFTKTKIKISRLLKTLQKEKIHMAIVKNKNNKVAGIITMEDILEELVGEIEDEYDEERDSIEELNQSEEVIVIDEENKPIE